MLEVKRTADIRQPVSSSTGNSRNGANQRFVNAVESGHGGALDRGHYQPVDSNNGTRIPVITGEAHFEGTMPVDGMLFGKLGEKQSGLHVRQRKRSAPRPSQPELSGQLSFKELVRINGHIAGTVYSEKGTLIVDSSAAVDANVSVGIALIKGTVNGDIVAQQRVELGPNAKVFGNIWTRSIAIEVGATFDGECTMLLDD